MNPKIQLEVGQVANGFYAQAPNYTWSRYRIAGSPSTRPLVAEQDGEGWLERFAQACYDRGREDERAMRETDRASAGLYGYMTEWGGRNEL